MHLPSFAFDRRWFVAAALFLTLTTLLRLFQLPALELAPDEAYYWEWSRRLALGYYDQGPMVAYVIRLTTMLFGTNEFGVRFGMLASSLGTLCCCYTLARRLFSPLTGFIAVVLLGLTPLMALGSVIATYDPPLVFFWALALLFLERAFFGPEEGQSRSWMLAGVATGLGFLTKHTMLLIAPCVLLFLAMSPDHRHWLRRKEPYLAFLLVPVFYSGVLWWNAHHHWWTFQHLLFLTKKTMGVPIRRFGDFIGSQALLLGPGLFLAVLAACARGLGAFRPRAKGALHSGLGPHPSSLFLICLGLPVFLFFCLMSLKAKAQGNWAPCAWLTPTILFAAWMTEKAGRSRAESVRTARTLGLLGALSAFVTVVILCPPLQGALGLAKIIPPDQNISNEAFGWRRLAAQVQAARVEMEQGGHRVFIAGNGYQYAALLAFYLPDHPETHNLFLHFRLTMYAAHVERLKDHLGEDALYVNNNQVEDPYLRQLFEGVTWDAPRPVYRRPLYPQPIRTIWFARCTNFRRYVGLDWADGG